MNNISKNQIEEISFQAGYIFNKIGIPDYKRDYMDDNYERIIRVFLHEDCSPDYEEWDYELERKIKIFWKKGYEKGNNLRKKLYEREQKKNKKNLRKNILQKLREI